ncbi:MAG: GntR family transcriptional regulator [Victivallaceae bacterium]|nr:GntR family transcriptional regulator [Victivallaceae bacterium]
MSMLFNKKIGKIPDEKTAVQTMDRTKFIQSNSLRSVADASSPIPKYHQLAVAIANYIKKEKLTSGDKLPPERELADRFQVSYLTARQAVASLEKNGILKRIHGKGTFVSTPQELKKRQIQFIFFNLDFYVSKIIEGIERCAAPFGHHLIVRDCSFDLANEKKALREIVNFSNNGLILYPGLKNSENNLETLKYLYKEKYPFVLVDRFFEELDSSYVVVDDFEGGYLAAKHLVSIGGKNIVCLSSAGINSSSMRNRINGYKQALADANIFYDENSIRHIHFTKNILNENIEEIRDIIKNWLKEKGKPIAVFATGDIIAFVILRVAFEMGLKVPGDIAIVGYGDIDTAELQVVPLTTVKIPMRKIGEEAARILLDEMAGKMLPAQRIALRPELIVRKSCGAYLKGY